MQSKKSDLRKIVEKTNDLKITKLATTQTATLKSLNELAKTQNMLMGYVQDLGHELDDLKIATGISRKKNIYFYKTSDKGH